MLLHRRRNPVVTVERAPGVPPLRPDPALVHQLEGDRRTIARYRRIAEMAVAEADKDELKPTK